jgi:hypothetical protein
MHSVNEPQLPRKCFPPTQNPLNLVSPQLFYYHNSFTKILHDLVYQHVPRLRPVTFQNQNLSSAFGVLRKDVGAPERIREKHRLIDSCYGSFLCHRLILLICHFWADIVTLFFIFQTYNKHVLIHAFINNTFLLEASLIQHIGEVKKRVWNMIWSRDRCYIVTSAYLVILRSRNLQSGPYRARSSDVQRGAINLKKTRLSLHKSRCLVATLSQPVLYAVHFKLSLWSLWLCCPGNIDSERSSAKTV